MTSAVVVWLFFVTASFSGTPVPGINEPHYLCKARAFADPEWCDRDFFLTSSNAHYCFYVLTGPLTLWMPLAWVAVIGRCTALAIVAWGWCRLGQSLRVTPTQCAAAALLMVLLNGVGSFSGEWIIGGFESKVPAWGLILGAMASWIDDSTQRLDQRHRRDACWTGLLAGMATALHPVVGMWAVIAMGMVMLAACLRPLRTEEPPGPVQRWKQLLQRALLMVLTFALPASAGIIPALQMLTGQDVSAKDKSLADFIQVFWRLKHHMDPTAFTWSQWVYTLVLSFATVGPGAWRGGRKSGQSGQSGGRRTNDNPENDLPQRLLERLLLASAVIAAVGVVIGWHSIPAREMQGWEWRAALLKFYPFRLFDGLLPIVLSFSLVSTPGRLRRPDASDDPDQSGLRLLRWPQAWCERLRQRPLISSFIGLLLIMAWYGNDAPPSGYTKTQFRNWRTACQWLQSNTPPRSLVLTPRESSSFKWFAERAEYVTYKDCPQDARGILEWNRRLWYLNGWTLASSSDGSYDQRDLDQLLRDTGCDYVLTRILGPFAEPPLFQSGDWQVYATRPSDATAEERLQPSGE